MRQPTVWESCPASRFQAVVILCTVVGVFHYALPCLCDELSSRSRGYPLGSLYNHGDYSEVVLPALPPDNDDIDSLSADFKNPTPLGFQIASSELSAVHLAHAESHLLPNMASQSDVDDHKSNALRVSEALVSETFAQDQIHSPSLLLDLSASVLAGVCPTSRLNKTVATRIIPSHCPQVSCFLVHIIHATLISFCVPPPLIFSPWTDNPRFITLLVLHGLRTPQ